MSKDGNSLCKAIFVDFFDTLVLRHVTARAVIDRWAVCLKKKFPCLSSSSNEELSNLRQSVFKELRKRLLESDTSRTEVTYEEALGEVYSRLSKFGISVDEESFVLSSKNIDLAIEIGSAKANCSLIKELQKAKEKGKRLFILSDYYLSEKEIRQIMISVSIPEGLFEHVYISCDIGKRKANGDAYTFVLSQIGLSACEVKMIGDNKKSDYEIPASLGLQTDYRPNIIYKVINHLKDIFKISYARIQSHKVVNEIYKHGMDYSEYINMFYIFTRRLYARLVEENASSIAFMAREGYYLKELFELYQALMIPEGEAILTNYYWCSRRSVMSGIKEALMPESMDGKISIKNWLKSLDISLEKAREYVDITDEEADIPETLEESNLYKQLMDNGDFKELFEFTINSNKAAFLKYTDDYIKDGIFRFVDSGWKCTIQNTLQANYGIKTIGYYIGVQKPDKPILDLNRTGLIFCEEKSRSRYYEYLGTNIPFYQQLLAAPHGTAMKYILDDDKVTIKSEWDSMEKDLYHIKIEKLQEYMRFKFMGLCAWDDKDASDLKEDWFLAKSAMRSSLFAHGTRLNFIRECTENNVQNFRQEIRGRVQYDVSKVKIGIDVIWRPEKLIRYFGKVQRTFLYDKRIVRIIYPLMSRLLYIYIILLQSIKNLKVVENDD